MYKQSKDRCAACEHSDNVIESQQAEIEELKNYQLHAQDDLTAKDKEIAESIPISAIEELIKVKSYVGGFASDGIIDVSDLEQLIKGVK